MRCVRCACRVRPKLSPRRTRAATRRTRNTCCFTRRHERIHRCSHQRPFRAGCRAARKHRTMRVCATSSRRWACVLNIKFVSRRLRDVRSKLGYRVDLLVENCVIVEIKAVEKLLPVHEAQLLSYLKLSGIRVGLLINFNVPRSAQTAFVVCNHAGIESRDRRARSAPCRVLRVLRGARSHVRGRDYRGYQLPSSTKSTPSRPMFLNLS